MVANGFRFLFADDSGELTGWISHYPERFGDFLDHMEAHGIPRAVALDSDTARATLGVRLFSDWLTNEKAIEFERDIRAGLLTFEDARRVHPGVFKAPAFQRFFALAFAAGKLPRGKPGKRRIHNPKVEALYALACRIYRETPGLSFEAACADATEQRPDLVPDTWREEPGRNLLREATRYWDKSPYSQLSYRQSRDK
ncbi:hypothetical protein ACFPTX_16070 [Pseudomonas sp. GCM10022188]|uniref:hypothetical protein n=1 Tax=Pseudomonas TaxID=286 RepID=UPI001E554A7E|nr:hypothetical protein [Pseudomonas oryzagri]MCC6076041.1 hypothetical protein [Pseudomonas oryzagri]